MNRSIVFAVILFTGGPASAGLVITNSVDNYSPNQSKPQHCIEKTYIEGKMMRSESQCSGGQGPRDTQPLMILRADKKLLWTVDPKTGRYSEITQDQMNSAVAIMKEEKAKAAKQWDEAYAKMSPEERRQMQNVGDTLKNIGLGDYYTQGPSAPAKHEYVRTHEVWTVSGRSCQVFQHIDNGMAINKVCTTKDSGEYSWARDFREMHGIMASLTGAMTEDIKADELAQQKAMGDARYILKDVVSVRGKPVTVREFAGVKQQSLAASLFQLPAGAVKNDEPWNIRQTAKVQP